MLTDLKDIDIKELSGVYDSDSRDVFISLYLNTEHLDDKFVERRASACNSVLKEDRDLYENFEKTMQTIEKYLDKNNIEKGQKALVIFASDAHGFFRAYGLSVPVGNHLIVDTSPYIGPIAMLIDEYETFGLILLDSHRAKIYVISSGRIEHKEGRSTEIMNKHKKGGWSQARFQRLRKGAIKHFLKEVSEDAEKLFSTEDVAKIVVAGSGNAKTMLKEYLPPSIKSRIIDIVDIDFDEAESKVVSKAEAIVQRDERETSQENVHKLKGEILKDGLAVYGLNETRDAARNGQLELLLIKKDHRIRGWICEKCQAFDAGAKDRCPNCGCRTSEVDVIEELIEFAERTDTTIEFVGDNTILDELGGVGGLMRFR